MASSKERASTPAILPVVQARKLAGLQAPPTSTPAKKERFNVFSCRPCSLRSLYARQNGGTETTCIKVAALAEAPKLLNPRHSGLDPESRSNHHPALNLRHSEIASESRSNHHPAPNPRQSGLDPESRSNHHPAPNPRHSGLDPESSPRGMTVKRNKVYPPSMNLSCFFPKMKPVFLLPAEKACQNTGAG